MLWYSKKKSKRILRCVLLWINGLFPFLWPVRHLLGASYPRGIFEFWRDYFQFKKFSTDHRFPLKFIDTYPALFDRYTESGIKPRHYFHQDWWAARKVFESKVTEHFDLGSRIDGFVAHCAVFCQIHVFDIRPLQPLNENIDFIQSDISNLKTVKTASLHSLSSLHVFEHIGLGRYGDPLGDQNLELAVNEVKRVLASKANFYFSVPIGIQRLEFNSQRVFAPQTVLDMFKEFELVEFSVVNDKDDLIINAQPIDFNQAEYSCGLFHFRKM